MVTYNFRDVIMRFDVVYDPPSVAQIHGDRRQCDDLAAVHSIQVQFVAERSTQSSNHRTEVSPRHLEEWRWRRELHEIVDGEVTSTNGDTKNL